MATPNAELAWRVIDHIDAEPELWDQEIWAKKTECGTVACFAGWTALIAGHRIHWNVFGDIISVGDDNRMDVFNTAAADLRITVRQADGLFHPDNTREDLGRLVAEIFGPRPEHCGYTLPHQAHDWVKLANDERPLDQDAHCDGTEAVTQ